MRTESSRRIDLLVFGIFYRMTESPVSLRVKHSGHCVGLGCLWDAFCEGSEYPRHWLIMVANELSGLD